MAKVKKEELDIYLSENKEKFKTFIRAYNKENGKIPNYEAFMKEFEVTKYQAGLIYRMLQEPKENFFKINYNNRKIVEDNKVVKDEFHWIFNILRWVIAVVCFGAGAVSINNTAKWANEYYGVFWGFVVAVTVIVVTACSLDIAKICFLRRRRFLGVVFVIIMIIGLCISITSTIASQYNEKIKVSDVGIVRESNVLAKKGEFDIYLDKENQISASIQDRKEQRLGYKNIVDKFDSVEKVKADKGIYDNTIKKMEALNKEIKEYEKELEDVRSLKQSYYEKEKNVVSLVTGVDNRKSFYVQMGKILGNIDPMYVEFWMSVFVAIFFDLLVPFSLSFVFLIGGKDDKRRVKDTFK